MVRNAAGTPVLLVSMALLDEPEPSGWRQEKWRDWGSDQLLANSCMKNPSLPARLRNNREFSRVYEEGRRYHTPFFNGFLRLTGGAVPRIGFTVTRKIGNSVVRNRCKRRLRELVRGYLVRRPSVAEKGFELVLNAKPALFSADYPQLEAAFARMMQALIGEREGRPERQEKE